MNSPDSGLDGMASERRALFLQEVHNWFELLNNPELAKERGESVEISEIGVNFAMDLLLDHNEDPVRIYDQYLALSEATAPCTPGKREVIHHEEFAKHSTPLGNFKRNMPRPRPQCKVPELDLSFLDPSRSHLARKGRVHSTKKTEAIGTKDGMEKPAIEKPEKFTLKPIPFAGGNVLPEINAAKKSEEKVPKKSTHKLKHIAGDNVLPPIHTAKKYEENDVKKSFPKAGPKVACKQAHFRDLSRHKEDRFPSLSKKDVKSKRGEKSLDWMTSDNSLVQEAAQRHRGKKHLQIDNSDETPLVQEAPQRHRGKKHRQVTNSSDTPLVQEAAQRHRGKKYEEPSPPLPLLKGAEKKQHDGHIFPRASEKTLLDDVRYDPFSSPRKHRADRGKLLHGAT